MNPYLKQVAFYTRLNQPTLTGGQASLEIVNLKNLHYSNQNPFTRAVSLDVYKIKIDNIFQNILSTVSYLRFSQSISLANVNDSIIVPTSRDHIDGDSIGNDNYSENYIYQKSFTLETGTAYKTRDNHDELSSNMWPIPLFQLRPNDGICFKNFIHAAGGLGNLTYVHDLYVTMYYIENQR